MNLKDLGTVTLEDLELAHMLLEDMLEDRERLLAMLDANEKDTVLKVLRELAEYMVSFQNQKDWLAAAKAIYGVVEHIPKWQPELLPEVANGSPMGISSEVDDEVMTDAKIVERLEEYGHGIHNKIHRFVGEPSQAIAASGQSDVGQTKLQQIINHFFNRS